MLVLGAMLAWGSPSASLAAEPDKAVLEAEQSRIAASMDTSSIRLGTMTEDLGRVRAAMGATGAALTVTDVQAMLAGTSFMRDRDYDIGDGVDTTDVWYAGEPDGETLQPVGGIDLQ